MTTSSTHVTADFRTLSIGPVQIGKHSVRLRPAMIGDAPRWRDLRMRDRDLIEPFWISTEQDWEGRHTENAWIREVLVARHHARTRRALSMVIEVDGQFSGQCNLTAIDMIAREAELGIWVEARVAGHSVSTLASGLIVDYGFEVLGLRRIIAPVATENSRAINALRGGCFRRETALPAFVSTGGGDWIDHELWSLTPDLLPEGGLVGLARRRVDPHATTLRIEKQCSVVRRTRTVALPTSVSELRAIARYHLGSVRRLQRRLVPIRIPEAAIARGSNCALRLRRVRIRDSLIAQPRAHGATSVITPLRRGSWFAASGPAVAFHITLHHSVIGRAELVGLSDHHRIAEAVVAVDRDHADVDITSEATRMLLDVGRTSLDLQRISGATDPDDDFATAVAVAAGMHHQGRIADTAVRNGVLGDIDLWATEIHEN